MSGLTFLIDTMLATRLAQRVDLVPLKATLDIAAPGTVTAAQALSNDPRLASRAGAMQLQGGTQPASVHHDSAVGTGLIRAQGGAQLVTGAHAAYAAAEPAHSDGWVMLSATARTLSAMLDSADAGAPQVRGTEPLWPQAQDEPVAASLAATLARTVSDSGLFYESHLRQLAAGTRTRSQLAREPQALLGPQQAHAHAGGEINGGGSPAGRDDTQPGAPAQGQAPEGNPAAAEAHPQAMTLVRQQLELLAAPTFRWSGEAWPGATMDWAIHEEAQPEQPQRSQIGIDGDEMPRSWATRLVVDLPALKEVEARLSLTGDRLQVHLAARDEQTLDMFGQQRAELSAQLEQLGLRVAAGVQVQAWPQQPNAAP